MTLFLGIDGGGTKTELALIDATGRVLATRRVGLADPVEIGMQTVRHLLKKTVGSMLASHSTSPDDPAFALRPPRLTPALGATVLAAAMAKTAMSADTLERLQRNDLRDAAQ